MGCYRLGHGCCQVCDDIVEAGVVDIVVKSKAVDSSDGGGASRLGASLPWRDHVCGVCRDVHVALWGYGYCWEERVYLTWRWRTEDGSAHRLCYWITNGCAQRAGKDELWGGPCGSAVC